MTRLTGTYVYGSAAPEWGTEPLHRHNEEIRRRRQQAPKRKPKRKIDKVAVFLVGVTFAAVLLVGIFYIRLQFQATYMSKSVVKLQREVVEMEKTVSTAKMELENSVDLEEIYNKATGELGMKAAKKDQILTYESRKSTQVRQHGEIPEE